MSAISPVGAMAELWNWKVRTPSSPGTCRSDLEQRLGRPGARSGGRVERLEIGEPEVDPPPSPAGSGPM